MPLVYKKIQQNDALKLKDEFFDNGKLKVSILLNDKEFTDGAKKTALTRLGRDLDKALMLSDDSEHMEGAISYGFLPGVDTPQTTNADAWHVSPRKRDYQNLWIKVMFDRGWVNSLPPKVNPDVDLNAVRHEVMLFTKTLESDLEDLQRILNRFHYQFKTSTAIGGEIQINFDGECTAGKISKIHQVLSEYLILNDKPKLEDLVKTNSAIQLGFDKDYKLLYVSFSEVPDCLCDNENLSAYILNKGFSTITTNPPFSSSTVNSLIHQLPVIKRKYAKYLTNEGVSASLFSTQQSWLDFVQTFVYPPVELSHSSTGTKYDDAAQQIGGIMDIIKNPLWSKLAGGAYLEDPTKLLSPEMREAIAASSNVMNIHTGDDALNKALMKYLL